MLYEVITIPLLIRFNFTAKLISDGGPTAEDIAYRPAGEEQIVIIISDDFAGYLAGILWTDEEVGAD